MSRNIIIAPGEFYHLYNRGTEKRNIFLSNTDYRRFQTLLYLANSTLPIDFKYIKRQGRTLSDVYTLDCGDKLVEIGAYVLMPNHFHILAKEVAAGGISHFMQKLSTAYTMYFNKKNERNGVLFQGKYKIRHVDTDEYLKYLISYIHLNPIKCIEPTWKETGVVDRIRAKEYLDTFSYSSYVDFLREERPEMSILSTEALPDYFLNKRSFEEEIMNWLDYKS